MKLKLSLWIIGLAALAASFVSITEFARAQGAHIVLVYAIPFALEPLALIGAWLHITARRKPELVVFLLAFGAAPAINVADAAGLPQDPMYLMALHAIPPAAVIGAGHLYLRDAARHTQVQDEVQALQHQVQELQDIAAARATEAKYLQEEMQSTAAQLQASQDRVQSLQEMVRTKAAEVRELQTGTAPALQSQVPADAASGAELGAGPGAASQVQMRCSQRYWRWCRSTSREVPIAAPATAI